MLKSNFLKKKLNLHKNTNFKMKDNKRFTVCWVKKRIPWNKPIVG